MDWIKVRTNLHTDPAVIAMSAALNLDEDTIVGKLVRLWGWADANLTDGYAKCVTESWVDKYVGVAQFAHHMCAAGWLGFDGSGLVFPNFDRHMGESAKKRAESQNRMRKMRYAKSVTTAQPEKRREEDNTPIVPKGDGVPVELTAQPQPGFDRFWKAYPRRSRKVDKTGCLRRWRRKGLENIAEQVIAGLERWKVSEDWTKQGGAFVCMPSVFLNQRRWEASPASAETPSGDVDTYNREVDELAAELWPETYRKAGAA